MLLPPPATPSRLPLRFGTGRRFMRAGRIMPVFLPFAGCPRRCVFCAQDRQTGQARAETASVKAILARAAASLGLGPHTPEGRTNGAAWVGPALPQRLELAFYGGTFTALPETDFEAALALFGQARQLGVIACGRCSTRPDAVSSEVLARLVEAGLDLVELGIQSFDDHALRLTCRGYNALTAETGCRAVTAAGLQLGIQLLPGMPGVSPDIFLRDVDRALALRPACLRFYPCLVPEGTGLAELWRAGRYAPWTVEETVRTLGEGLRRAWKAGVAVVRLAVAPEADFDAAVLAGPRHPALGSMIQAEALLRAIRTAVERLGRAPDLLSLPRSCQGYMYGQHGALRAAWAAMELSPDRIRFHAEPGDEGVLW